MKVGSKSDFSLVASDRSTTTPSLRVPQRDRRGQQKLPLRPRVASAGPRVSFLNGIYTLYRIRCRAGGSVGFTPFGSSTLQRYSGVLLQVSQRTRTETNTGVWTPRFLVLVPRTRQVLMSTVRVEVVHTLITATAWERHSLSVLSKKSFSSQLAAAGPSPGPTETTSSSSR